jgi:dTDP-4-amino-4,6-dideoxygalactose transaminase
MKISKIFKINKCGLCHNPKLEQIHNFGNIFVSNFVIKKNIKKSIEFKEKAGYRDIIKFIKKDGDKHLNSEHISKYGLYLPSYYDLKNSDVKFICNELNDLIA